MGDQPALRCSGLSKRFGDRTAVDGVGFQIDPGECYGLLGPNGAGKTTTISMICGLLPRDSGNVTVAGTAIDHRTVAARSHIGYVPQDVALYAELSAFENLTFFGRLQGLRGDELKRRVDDALASVGLSDRAGDHVGGYSGGMRRRANLAVGILHRPELLVLDEPTVGVDPQSRNAIFELVEQLCAGGMAVLYTTHYMEEAERLCDRIGIIDSGKLVAEGTCRELIAGIAGTDRVLISTGPDAGRFSDALAVLPGVASARLVDGGVEVIAAGGRRLLRTILDAADAARIEVTGIDVNEPDLEAVFLQLTGKALRD